jgi:peptidoglycan-associated lipoprotein
MLREDLAMHVHSTPIQNLRKLSALLGCVLALSLAGCGGKKETTEESEPTTPDTASPVENEMGDSDSGRAMGLQTVNFGYDSSTLDARAKEVLNANAEVMRDRASMKVQIEGHCDERGGIQYNIALGEKRANTTRQYLISKGVKGDRITTISFGKERPVDPASNEAAWTKNRRGNFVITSN